MKQRQRTFMKYFHDVHLNEFGQKALEILTRELYEWGTTHVCFLTRWHRQDYDKALQILTDTGLARHKRSEVEKGTHVFLTKDGRQFAERYRLTHASGSFT